jgi:type VI secretion system secreted protein VgrG
MATIVQEKRQLVLATPLGGNVLLLSGFSGQESLSRLFHYHLDMFSEDESIQAKDIVGKAVTWSVHEVHSEPRFFNGVVNRFVAAGPRIKGRRAYRAEVVPWLWLLTRTANCRIFQNLSVPGIIEKVIKDLGFSAYELHLEGSYAPREYCVQYRETACNFVSRLMEYEGIFYYFRHEEGKHTLVLGDSKSAFHDCVENEVEYLTGTLAPNSIHTWEHQYEFRTGKLAQTDYNFETPATSLLVNTQTVVDLPNIKKFEVFDYPGGYMKSGAGTGELKVRMQEEEAEHSVVSATSDCCSFTPGGKFKLKARECPGEEDTYLITSVTHSGTDTSYHSTAGGSTYQNTFTCMPASVPYRPARQTPCPTVQGVQTAVVVGPGGEEIYVDKYGRVKVQFFWDREGKKNENSSCWIRVSEQWAGKNWGFVCNPRIGQEVIVDFLEGDPDRPLITGRVYNAAQMPPYDLPGNKTQSGIKSRSSKGGGGGNFNEICFEDKAGSEMVTIHAEKDQTIGVEHDESHWVGHDRTKNIDHDETTHVKHDRTETVDNNETITVHGQRTETVDKDETITIHQNRTETVDKNESITVSMNRTRIVGIAETVTVGAAQAITVGAARAVTVGAAQVITVGASQTITVGSDETETYGGNHTQTVGGNQSVTVTGGQDETIGGGQQTNVAKDRVLDVGANDVLKVAKKLSVQAGDEIVFNTGDASITLKKDGTIQIVGKDITIKGSGKIIATADGNMTLKGSKIAQN